MRKIIYYGISTDAPFLTPPPFLPKFLELRLAMRSIPWRHTGHGGYFALFIAALDGAQGRHPTQNLPYLYK